MSIAQLKQTEIQPSSAILQDPETGEVIKVSFRLITPAQAKVMLAHNHPRNRVIRKQTVQDYKDQMIEGLWHPSSGESVKFAAKKAGQSTGFLVDGQHRLYALIASNKPCWLMIMEGIPECSFTAIDDGLNRDLSAALTIAGVQIKGSIQRMARALEFLYTVHKSIKNNVSLESLRGRIPKTVTLNFHSKLKGFNESADHFNNSFKYTSMQLNFNVPTAMTAYYIFEGQSDQIDEALFTVCKSLESGLPFDGLMEDSPSYYLMKRIRLIREKKSVIRASIYLDMFTWCLEKTIRGEGVKSIPAKFDKWQSVRRDFVTAGVDKIKAIG